MEEGTHNFHACEIHRTAELEGPSGPPKATPSFYSSGSRTPRLSKCPKVTQPINGRAQMGIPRPPSGPERESRVKNTCRCLCGPLGCGARGVGDVHGNHPLSHGLGLASCLLHPAAVPSPVLSLMGLLPEELQRAAVHSSEEWGPTEGQGSAGPHWELPFLKISGFTAELQGPAASTIY